MSYFRQSQKEAHPNKTNILMTGIITLLILFVSMQIWFLFGALNNALTGDINFAITTFIGSVILAISSFLLLRYLPDPIEDESIKKK
jgi:threonine/homoserine/homoserine lactone efflux protein